MTARHPGDPGYLGPDAEAQREREMIAAKLASPQRTRVEQDDPATLALFAPHMEPSFL